ncbi:MAG TPA: hypothetical protein PK453_04455 [Leptospiraceae bacterium]|nr:hypothetical protein [Leptospiraceae bacterium]HNF26483.1 hypothetical protein [Leptospiraceae bacterium]HNM03878.1 hypothetical protein [Leptospiraceae bacterium]HNN03356.1 hypothetical protein [Leptospiraceae bacterium]
MALVRCKECESEISENAVSCPKCGNPIKQAGKENSLKSILKSNKKILLSVIVLPMLLLILFAIGIEVIERSRSARYANIPKNDELSTVYYMQNQQGKLAPGYHQSISIDVKSAGSLHIKVIEINGRNIDFVLLREGQQIYYSDIHSGKAEATMSVGSGRYHLKIMNDNVLDSKNYEATVFLIK